MSKVITLLGSTGSIGTQSLDVCRMHGYEVFGLSANSSVDKLLAQIAEFHPKYVAVTDPATVECLSQLNVQVMGSEGDPFYGAKTVVVVLVDRSVPTHLEDGSLAMGNLLNAAYALGVDSCWIHRAHEVFDSPEGLELLASWDLPADGSLRGVGHCILGYAEDTLPEPKPRRDNVVYVK